MLRIKSIHATCLALVLVMIGVGTSSLFALDPNKTIAQYGHSVWFRQNGLPTNAVNTALQTRDGYIWLGTSAGLFRFDGVSFTKITIDADDDTREMVPSLLESRDSSLWIGTGYSGLRRIRNGKLFRYGLKEGFHDTQVLNLIESRLGHVWIGTSSGAYVLSDGKFLAVLSAPNYIIAMSKDLRGRIWLGTHQGVRILEDSLPSRVIDITTSEGLPSNVTTSMCADRQGNVWIGTINGLVRWNNGKIKVYTDLDGLSDNHIMAIYEDHDGNLWVGTSTGGINRLSNGKWTTFTNKDGLSDNQVLSILEDHEGDLWVCTSDGLNEFKDVSITTYTTYDGLANNYISSVIETPDRSLYFLSDQGSNVTKLRNGKITKYDILAGPAYVAHDGSLWMGQSGMLNKFKTNRITRYDTTAGIPARWISAITEDSISLIIHADHTGIFRFVHEQLKPYLMEDGRPYSFKGYVSCFYTERKSVLWIGTADSLVKIQKGKSTVYTTADGMAGNWVSSMYDDNQGNLWISSPKGGLTRHRNGKFTAYNTKVGLFANEIYCVLGDNQGGIWLSSPSGIGFVQRQELDDFAEGRVFKIHSKVYVTADGMKTDECFGSWQPAGWKTDDGNLWFATRKGAVRIDPRALIQNPTKPPVLIEQVVVDQQIFPTDEFTSLPPGADKVEIHYAGLSYAAPERVRFKYILEGYDKEWIDAGTRRVAYYTGLPPYNYRFRVMACNNDGVWNETGASFGFELRPEFYETYWFFGLVLIALGGSAFGAYRLRVWQLLQREKDLSARIQEALANIKVLGGLIPICSNCKKIRDDKGYWDLLEGYIQNHSEAKFSHGICPDCASKLYPDIFPPKSES